MLSTPKKAWRVIVYGTLGIACIAALIVALAIPDELDGSEGQIAALYLALLVGSNKAFNARPVFGSQMLGAIATFIGLGLLPATIIHIALVDLPGIEPGLEAHLGSLIGFGLVTAISAFLVVLLFWIPLNIWTAWEKKQRQRVIKATPGWVPRLD